MDTAEQRFRTLLTEALNDLPAPPSPASIEARGMRPVRRPATPRHRLMAVGALTAAAIAVVFVLVAAVVGNDNTKTKVDTSGTVTVPPSSVVASTTTAVSSGKVLRTLTVDGETWRFVDDNGCLRVLDPAGEKQVERCGEWPDFSTSSVGRDYKGVRYVAIVGPVPTSVTRVELEMRWGETFELTPTDRFYLAVMKDQSHVPGRLNESPSVAAIRFFTAQGLLCGVVSSIVTGPPTTGLASCPRGITTTTQ